MEKICAVCIYGKPLMDGEFVLCEKNGPMRATATCRKQQTDLTKINIRRKRTIAKMPENK